MYLIPLVRTSRAVAACTLIPNTPILAVSASEIISYTFPFINNSPIFAIDHMILFLIYYFYNNEETLQIMDQYKNKNKEYYKIESFSIILYLSIYFYKILFN